MLSIKKLLSNEVEVFTTPFKQKATEKVFINTVEGVRPSIIQSVGRSS
ncbi:hypothetical protein ACVPOQ_12615 [Staphylococcus aureus]